MKYEQCTDCIFCATQDRDGEDAKPCKFCNDGSRFSRPLDFSGLFGEEGSEPEPIIKDSGERTEFSTGAVRDMHGGKGRFDLVPWEAIWELAKHCEAGAEKYGERNCEKGIPIHSLIDSAIRHLAKYLMGWNDEPHLRAALWNVAFAIYMEQKHPEMQDIPARKEQAE